MVAFVTAYLLVWCGVLGYLLRLGARQRRLEQAVESLQARIAQSPETEQATSQAA
ncbi:MAG: CcmD family protein [Pirellulales bacterium]